MTPAIYKKHLNGTSGSKPPLGLMNLSLLEIRKYVKTLFPISTSGYLVVWVVGSDSWDPRLEEIVTLPLESQATSPHHQFTYH